MKILWVSHRDVFHPASGGAERTAFELAVQFDGMGDDVHVLSGAWNGALAHEVVNGVNFHRFYGRVLPHLVLPIVERLSLRPDLIIDDLAHVVPWGSPQFTNTPGVAFFRHLHARTLGGQVGPVLARVLARVERSYSRIYAKWPFVTESTSSVTDLVALGVDARRIKTLPPGVDVTRYHPGKRSQQPLLVYFGGLKAYKRPDLALRLLWSLRNRGIDASLVVIGSGPLSTSMRNLAAELGIAKWVFFHGRLSDKELPEIVRRGWVNLHFSVAEGWCLSAMEAAASGLPTVAFKIPGLVDSVVDGRTGFLVTGGDFSALVDRTVLAIEGCEELGANARSWAEEHSWAIAAKRWHQWLEAL